METSNGTNEAVSVTKTNGSTAAVETSPEPHERSPFAAMRRFAEEMDRTFNEWSFGRGLLTPFFGRDPLSKRMEEFGKDLYLPDIEVVEKDGTMTVRADLPGIAKEDVTVEITGNPTVEITGASTGGAKLYQPGEQMFNFGLGRQAPIQVQAAELYVSSWPTGVRHELKLSVTASRPFSLLARASLRRCLTGRCAWSLSRLTRARSRRPP